MGCKGQRDGCSNFHPRMCKDSLSERGCPIKDCKAGYHVKKRAGDKRKMIPGLQAPHNAQMMEGRSMNGELRQPCQLSGTQTGDTTASNPQARSGWGGQTGAGVGMQSTQQAGSSSDFSNFLGQLMQQQKEFMQKQQIQQQQLIQLLLGQKQMAVSGQQMVQLPVLNLQ